MERNNYENVLKLVEQKTLNDAIDFLQSIPVFSPWTRHALAKLQYYFKKKACIKNAIIYKSGDIADKLYIVKSGEFELTRKVISPYAKRYEIDYLSHFDESPVSKEKKMIDSLYNNLLANKIFLKPVLTKDINVFLHYF